jgi:hypothetical protein
MLAETILSVPPPAPPETGAPWPWIAILISAISLAFAISAFVRAGRWRRQERREALPDFTVSVEPLSRSFTLVRTVEGERRARSTFETSEVLVTVQNRSIEDATLNHASLLVRSDKAQAHDPWTCTPVGLFPARLEGRGGQVSWTIPGERFGFWMQSFEHLSPETIAPCMYRQTFLLGVSVHPRSFDGDTFAFEISLLPSDSRPRNDNERSDRVWYSRLFAVERTKPRPSDGKGETTIL